MGDINIKQLESLRWRMRVIETLTVIGTAWIALAVYQKKEELVYYLVGAVVLLFLLKYYTQFRLRKRQFVLLAKNIGQLGINTKGIVEGIGTC